MSREERIFASQGIGILRDESFYHRIREKELALELFKSIPFLWRTVETFQECLMVIREQDIE